MGGKHTTVNEITTIDDQPKIYISTLRKGCVTGRRKSTKSYCTSFILSLKNFGQIFEFGHTFFVISEFNSVIFIIESIVLSHWFKILLIFLIILLLYSLISLDHFDRIC